MQFYVIHDHQLLSQSNAHKISTMATSILLVAHRIVNEVPSRTVSELCRRIGQYGISQFDVLIYSEP